MSENIPTGANPVVLPPFSAWLASNIPAVYDNTMSYYEELTSLIHYLETVILPTLNEDSEAVTSLSNLYKELKSYVENYFKNLDVQEEINNKLDQMAETGALETIIVNYFKTFQIDYETFGAVGDGETDDYTAIKLAHEYANEHNLKVVGAPEKTYYVKDFTSPIPIKTDVDWNNCHFIIDDSDNPSTSALFEVQYDNAKLDLTNVISTLSKDQTKCNLVGYGNLICKFVNSNKKDFIRTGSGADSGSNRTEYTRIDDKGNILDGIYFPFEAITSIEAYKLDKHEITIKNATFTTVCNEISSNNYYNRGINVTRSNVTFKNITHLLDNETETMSPYNGIFYITFSSNVKLIDCYLSGHKTVTYDGNQIGSYDVNMSGCIDCTLQNVQQVNSITDDSLWSIHGSNYCKNLTFNNCKLSNIDAHRGIKNLYINDCVVGGKRIGFCGWGEVIINNTKVLSATFCRLRNDYGSWFDGDIIINNCTSASGNSNYSTYYILSIEDTDIEHDYGYEPFIPNLEVKNFTFEGSGSDSLIYLYKLPNETHNSSIDYSVSYDDNSVYPHVLKNHIKIDGVKAVPAYKHIYLFRYEIAKIYADKTGITFAKNNTNRMDVNQPNFYIDIKGVDFNPTLNLASYTVGDCDLWTSQIYNPTISDNTATHIPVIDISLESCNNLHVDTVGRPMTLNLKNCTIQYLQRATGYSNRTLVNCDKCIFIIEHGEGDDRGFIYARNNTYNITNSTFKIIGDTTSLLASELCLHAYKTKNASITFTNNIENCSIVTTINLVSYFETPVKYYGLSIKECLNNKYGTLIFRQAGSDSNKPNPTDGVIATELGNNTLPTGSTYFVSSSPYKLYKFNGSAWVDVLA